MKFIPVLVMALCLVVQDVYTQNLSGADSNSSVSPSAGLPNVAAKKGNVESREPVSMPSKQAPSLQDRSSGKLDSLPKANIDNGSPQTEQSLGPISNRGFYVDLSAALFGWLAVLFALATVGLSVFGIVWGITKLRDLLRRVEIDLRQKVDTEFARKVDDVVRKEIEPRVKTIIDTQLDQALQTGKQRIEAEIGEILTDSDRREALVKDVFGEIQKRLAAPQPTKVEPEEFN